MRYLFSVGRRDLGLAWNDIARGAVAWNVWHLLAMQELRQRYRRSTLGPLWISISLGIQVAVMVFLVAVLFKQEFRKYMPYATLGLILWNFMSTALVEGANCFVSASAIFLQMKQPLFAFVVHVLWRNLIVLAHTIIVYVIVAVIFSVPITAATVLFVPGLVLFITNMAWMLLLIGVISARFRDVHLIVQASMSIFFWITPIIFYPAMLESYAWITDVNPLTHLLEIVRAPILGHSPAPESWLVAIAMNILGWTIAFMFFARFRARIPYWI
jgi:homopolymeric O-antigen transport system permease protein